MTFSCRWRRERPGAKTSFPTPPRLNPALFLSSGCAFEEYLVLAENKEHISALEKLTQLIEQIKPVRNRA